MHTIYYGSEYDCHTQESKKQEQSFDLFFNNLNFDDYFISVDDLNPIAINMQLIEEFPKNVKNIYTCELKCSDETLSTFIKGVVDHGYVILGNDVKIIYRAYLSKCEMLGELKKIYSIIQYTGVNKRFFHWFRKNREVGLSVIFHPLMKEIDEEEPFI